MRMDQAIYSRQPHDQSTQVIEVQQVEAQELHALWKNSLQMVC